jgi:hypothetical protein
MASLTAVHQVSTGAQSIVLIPLGPMLILAQNGATLLATEAWRVLQTMIQAETPRPL